MKRLYLLALSLGFFFTAFGQQTFHTTPTSTIAYLEYLPKDYGQNSDKYPVVFFLHGLGEKGPNSTNIDTLKKYINIAARNGPPKMVNNGTQFPFILITPQLKSNYGDWPSAYVKEVMDYCKTYLRIDDRRVYLTGLSLGGGGTWWTAQDYPKEFAAIAPVCGSRNTPAKACLLSAENLPVWGFHGDADGTVPLYKTVNMINAINKCVPTPNPLAKITIYPGIGHNCWDKAYTNDHTVQDPNVWEWMLAQTNTVNGTNRIPVSNAGQDVIMSLPVTSLTLQSACTDADGKITNYQWTQKGGAALGMTNANTSALVLSNLAEGTYNFCLQVTDDAGDMDCDYIKVTIVAAQKSVNMPPVVNAGADRIIKLPSVSNTLFGSAYDPDGKIIGYRWSQVSGAACTISSTTVSRPKISGLKSGVYVFRLFAYDDTGVVSSDDVTITADIPPVVSAGANVTITLPTSSLTLKGTATDSDGKIISYTWSKDSGPAVTLTNKLTAAATASKLTAGTYVFRLVAKDNVGVGISAYVTVIVLPSINGRQQTVAAHEPIDASVLTSTDPEWQDSKIIVFNQAGQKIHEGAWSADQFNTVFGRPGFYIFHLNNAQHHAAGKLVIQE